MSFFDRKFKCYEEITPDILIEDGVSCLLCDLDFTLAPRWLKYPTDSLVMWLENMADAGIQVIVVSNCYFHSRVKKFCDEANKLAYVWRARKPSPSAVFMIMRDLDVQRKNIAFVGNSVVTDMICAKKAHIKAYKVSPRNYP